MVLTWPTSFSRSIAWAFTGSIAWSINWTNIWSMSKKYNVLVSLILLSLFFSHNYRKENQTCRGTAHLDGFPPAVYPKLLIPGPNYCFRDALIFWMTFTILPRLTCRHPWICAKSRRKWPVRRAIISILIDIACIRCDIATRYPLTGFGPHRHFVACFCHSGILTVSKSVCAFN